MVPIIQIIPFRRLVPDGVGDYGRLLATEWAGQRNVKTIFVATTPKDFEGECEDGHQTIYLKRSQVDELLAELRPLLKQYEVAPPRVILHMSAYGFQKRGVPFWLLKAVKMFRAQYPTIKVLSVFHEIYATSNKPWTSSFYLSGLQKHIAKQIFKLSDCVITPCEKYAMQLKRYFPSSADKVKALPVFSTVGELSDLIVVEKTERLVLFGGRDQRNEIFTKYSSVLSSLVEKLNLVEIVDIGANDPGLPDHINGVTIRHTGRLSAEDVSREFSASRYGVVSYDPMRLGKSTVLASMAAHNVNIICLAKTPSTSEGLVNGRHLIVTNKALNQDQLLTLPHLHSAMTEWYQQHQLSAQIPIFEDLMENS